MRYTYILGLVVIAVLLQAQSCCEGCCGAAPAATDAQGNAATPPASNQVNTCKVGQSVECAGGGVSKCDCSGEFCKFTSCQK